jgi:DNA (cytosine-5)-methyltransferase 1
MRVLSLFTGMGGMDVGFAEQAVVRRESVDGDVVESDHEVAGFVRLKRLPFEIVFQNDILKCAQKIAGWNGWSHNYVLKDIRELIAENYEFPEADVIIGGFPCQDFSHAGKRAGLESERGTLYQSYVEVVRRVRPAVFVAENVNGLLTMPGAPIQRIVADFAEVGYEVKYELLKCEEIGIPQTRWRVIIMGLRLDKKTPSHGDDWNVISDRRVCVARPYFEHLQEPDVTTDPAQKVYSKAARLEKGQGQSQVPPDGFAPTVRAEHHGNIEFRNLERRMTVREAALLQTFPPDCVLSDPAKKPTLTAYKPIGNAVPPLLGYVIGRQVLRILQQQPSSPC